MSDEQDEFFVGYLPTPMSRRRWLRMVALASVVMVAALGAIVAAMQRDPGSGKWDLENPTSFEGVLDIRPYPLLNTPAGTYLIVAEGKHGAAKQLEAFAGNRLRLRGNLIMRSSRKMIELSDASDAIEVSTAMPQRRTESAPGSITVVGEIIDPKCFLGAMKPGDGKTHKACAALCLRGGVPPMFLESDGADFLLANAAGDAVQGNELDQLVRFVGDRVELHGDVKQRGDLRILCIDLWSIRRL